MATGNQLAGNIRRYLKSKNLGVFKGSEVLGLKKHTLSNLINHPQRVPRQKTLKILSGGMGVEADELISKRVSFNGSIAATSKRAAKTGNGKIKRRARRSNGHANGTTSDRGRLFNVALTLCGYELPAKHGRSPGETLAAVVTRLEKVMGDIEQEAG